MFVHSEKLNPCKCGSKKKPDLDSDDMVACWAVTCFDCRQCVHDSNWTMSGAVEAWNKENPLKSESVKYVDHTSRKLSSYQKMKQKYEESIRELTDDIITLVEEKDPFKTTTVKMRWRMRLEVEKSIWHGDKIPR